MTPRRWYWKAYLVLIAALTVGGIALSIMWWEDTPVLDRITDWISLPMYIVQVVGLSGFIYFRRIGSLLLWKLVFAGTVLEFGWAAWQMIEHSEEFSGFGTAFAVGMPLTIALASVPMLIALYIYAFRSQALWASPA
jgi:hypothetical protein